MAGISTGFRMNFWQLGYMKHIDVSNPININNNLLKLLIGSQPLINRGKVINLW